MQDLEDRLKELGDRVLQQAPSELRPTPRALRRIRVGRAVRVGAVLATVAALVIGGFSAADLLGERSPIQPADGEASPSQPTPRETPENAAGFGPRYEILNGEVIFRAAEPWGPSLQTMVEIGEPQLPELTLVKNGMEKTVDGDPVTKDGDPVKNPFDFGASLSEAAFVVHADPGPPPLSCSGTEDPAASAEALARAIGDDPRLNSTEPVAERVAGVDALRSDVVPIEGASTCSAKSGDYVPALMAKGFEGMFLPHIHGLRHGERMRLYLLDLAGSDARTLAIMIVAPEANFNAAVAAARPIIHSFEFRGMQQEKTE